ncbi:MAG: hypothetical protein QNK23_16710 [Crocinitomicaceae bacterium]|nr:hypothetical protein [Crocinitomicaceae bacterium]
MKKFYLLFIVLISLSANAQDSTRRINFGEFHFTSQSLFMGREKNRSGSYYDSTDRSQFSHTNMLKFNYESPVLNGFQFKTELVGAFAEYGDGYSPATSSVTQDLANSRMRIINKLNLSYTFHFGAKGTGVLSVGRKDIQGSFTPSYAVRHKDQAYEALEFTLTVDSTWFFSAGHIQRFSGWKSTQDFSSFKEIYELNNPSYGMQFVQWRHDSLGQVKLETYNFYAYNLYNTFGVHIDWQAVDRNQWGLVIKPRYQNQSTMGEYRTNLNAVSHMLQTGVQLTYKKFSIEPGVLYGFGSSNGYDFKSPFQAALIVKEPLFETEAGLNLGNISYYLESKISLNRFSIYGLYFRTDKLTNGFVEEYDIIAKYAAKKFFYTAFKIGYAHYYDNAASQKHILDYRLFIGIKI